jgi:hypothetical protein
MASFSTSCGVLLAEPNECLLSCGGIDTAKHVFAPHAVRADSDPHCTRRVAAERAAAEGLLAVPVT